MHQQRYCIVIVLILYVFYASSSSIAAPSPGASSSPAKPFAAPPPSPLAFFDKPQSNPRLDADPRLDRKVTLDEIGTPLDTLLTKMSDASLPLTCETACADNKLQVRVINRPLRSVMAAIAQMTPGTWQVEIRGKIKGYRLEVDPKATDYENQWWVLYAAERERALTELRTQVLVEMQEKPQTDFRNEDGSPLDPDARQEMIESEELWYFLPEPLQKQIADQLVDTPYYRAGNLTANHPVEGATVVPFQSLPLKVQTTALSSAARMLDGNKMGVPVAASFNNVGFYVVPRIRTAEGRWHSLDCFLSVDTDTITPTLSLNHKRLPDRVKKMGDQAPETWKPLAKYQEQRIWLDDPTIQNPNLHPDHPLDYPPRRPEVLTWLAGQAGVEFIADYYSVASDLRSPVDQHKRLTRPLKQELDYRAAQEDMSWKKRSDGLYLFRDNRWYRNDRLEVPDKILLRLMDTLRKDEAAEYPVPPAGTPKRFTKVIFKHNDGTVETSIVPAQSVLVLAVTPADAFAKQLSLADEIVSKLSPYQIANGLLDYIVEPGSRFYDPAHPEDSWQPFGPITNVVLDDYDTYLFHSGLDPDLSGELLSGTLPASALTSAQLQQAAFLLPDIQIALQSQPPQPLLLGMSPDDMGIGMFYQSAFRGQELSLERIRLAIIPAQSGINIAPEKGQPEGPLP